MKRLRFLYYESICIVFYFYICLFSFLNSPAKYTYSLPENKTLFMLFVYYVYFVFVMCIFVLDFFK